MGWHVHYGVACAGVKNVILLRQHGWNWRLLSEQKEKYDMWNLKKLISQKLRVEQWLPETGKSWGEVDQWVLIYGRIKNIRCAITQ